MAFQTETLVPVGLEASLEPRVDLREVAAFIFSDDGAIGVVPSGGVGVNM